MRVSVPPCPNAAGREIHYGSTRRTWCFVSCCAVYWFCSRNIEINASRILIVEPELSNLLSKERSVTLRTVLASPRMSYFDATICFNCDPLAMRALEGRLHIQLCH
jgi:hypothetical protein